MSQNLLWLLGFHAFSIDEIIKAKFAELKKNGTEFVIDRMPLNSDVLKDSHWATLRNQFTDFEKNSREQRIDISFIRCGFELSQCQELVKMLSSAFTKIKIALNLSQNFHPENAKSKAAENTFESFASLVTEVALLYKLDLSDCRICSLEGFTLSPQRQSRLVCLILTKNAISGAGAGPLFDSILQWQCGLRRLIMDDNNLGQEGADRLASVLGNSACPLEHVNVASNKIPITGMKILLLALQTNTKLITFDLRNNFQATEDITKIENEVDKAAQILVVKNELVAVLVQSLAINASSNLEKIKIMRQVDILSDQLVKLEIPEFRLSKQHAVIDDEILVYLKETRANLTNKRRLKTIVLGSAKSGKTSFCRTLHSLTVSAASPPATTAAAAATAVEEGKADMMKRLQVFDVYLAERWSSFWDLSIDDDKIPAFSYLFDDRSLFIITLSAADDMTSIQQQAIRYLSIIRRYVKRAPILFVLTRYDHHTTTDSAFEKVNILLDTLNKVEFLTTNKTPSFDVVTVENKHFSSSTSPQQNASWTIYEKGYDIFLRSFGKLTTRYCNLQLPNKHEIANFPSLFLHLSHKYFHNNTCTIVSISKEEFILEAKEIGRITEDKQLQQVMKVLFDLGHIKEFTNTEQPHSNQVEIIVNLRLFSRIFHAFLQLTPTGLFFADRAGIMNAIYNQMFAKYFSHAENVDFQCLQDVDLLRVFLQSALKLQLLYGMRDYHGEILQLHPAIITTTPDKNGQNEVRVYYFPWTLPSYQSTVCTLATTSGGVKKSHLARSIRTELLETCIKPFYHESKLDITSASNKQQLQKAKSLIEIELKLNCYIPDLIVTLQQRLKNCLINGFIWSNAFFLRDEDSFCALLVTSKVLPVTNATISVISIICSEIHVSARTRLLVVLAKYLKDVTANNLNLLQITSFLVFNSSGVINTCKVNKESTVQLLATEVRGCFLRDLTTLFPSFHYYLLLEDDSKKVVSLLDIESETGMILPASHEPYCLQNQPDKMQRFVRALFQMSTYHDEMKCARILMDSMLRSQLQTIRADINLLLPCGGGKRGKGPIWLKRYEDRGTVVKYYAVCPGARLGDRWRYLDASYSLRPRSTLLVGRRKSTFLSTPTANAIEEKEEKDDGNVVVPTIVREEDDFGGAMVAIVQALTFLEITNTENADLKLTSFSLASMTELESEVHRIESGSCQEVAGVWFLANNVESVKRAQDKPHMSCFEFADHCMPAVVAATPVGDSLTNLVISYMTQLREQLNRKKREQISRLQHESIIGLIIQRDERIFSGLHFISKSVLTLGIQINELAEERAKCPSYFMMMPKVDSSITDMASFINAAKAVFQNPLSFANETFVIYPIDAFSFKTVGPGYIFHKTKAESKMAVDTLRYTAIALTIALAAGKLITGIPIPIPNVIPVSYEDQMSFLSTMTIALDYIEAKADFTDKFKALEAATRNGKVNDEAFCNDYVKPLVERLPVEGFRQMRALLEQLDPGLALLNQLMVPVRTPSGLTEWVSHENKIAFEQSFPRVQNPFIIDPSPPPRPDPLDVPDSDDTRVPPVADENTLERQKVAKKHALTENLRFLSETSTEKGDHAIQVYEKFLPLAMVFTDPSLLAQTILDRYALQAGPTGPYNPDQNIYKSLFNNAIQIHPLCACCMKIVKGVAGFPLTVDQPGSSSLVYLLPHLSMCLLLMKQNDPLLESLINEYPESVRQGFQRALPSLIENRQERSVLQYQQNVAAYEIRCASLWPKLKPNKGMFKSSRSNSYLAFKQLIEAVDGKRNSYPGMYRKHAEGKPRLKGWVCEECMGVLGSDLDAFPTK